MELSGIGQQDLASVQNALGMAVLKKAMNQDSQTMNLLLQGFQETTAQMEQSVSSNLGANIDIRV